MIKDRLPKYEDKNSRKTYENHFNRLVNNQGIPSPNVTTKLRKDEKSLSRNLDM